MVLVCTLFVYRGALWVGYLSDDFVLVNAHTGVWRQGSSELFRVLPVVLIRWSADSFGGSTASHAINIVRHCVNGLLVHRLALAVGFSEGASILAASLFLAFPAAAEPVVWISGLQDLLMTTATLLFVNGIMSSWSPVVLLMSLCAGLLSKESAVVMPVLAGIALWTGSQTLTSRTRRILGASLVIAATFALWRIVGNVDALATPLTRYRVKEILAGAFGTLALPWTVDELASLAALGMLMVLTIMAAAWIVLSSDAPVVARRSAVGGLLWVVVASAPAYSLFFVSAWLEGSRYLYLPMVGWALSLAAATTVPSRAGRRFALVLGLVSIIWFLSAGAHVVIWQRAALMRDRILGAADSLGIPQECAGIAMVGVTDNVQGAYVFRNGLREALQRSDGGRHLVQSPSDADCVFGWNGRSFLRVR